MELSLESPHSERKKEVTAKPSAPAPSMPAADNLAKPLSDAMEEVHTSSA